MMNYFCCLQSDTLWIGGSDTVTEKTWKWVTGEAIDMKHVSEGGNWYAGEPNDKNSGQDCLVTNYWKGAPFSFWVLCASPDQTTGSNWLKFCMVAYLVILRGLVEGFFFDFDLGA